MTRTEAIEAACRVDGWSTPGELGRLYDLAKAATGPIVEIGSHWGRSTAALALGSMAGGKHTVFAVDPFIGVPEAGRPTDVSGVRPGLHSSSPEMLRRNLDSAGVNGLVRIVPLPSLEAVSQLPDCSVLFVDGNHEYAAVRADLDAYLPKVLSGGSVMLHDVIPIDMGVIQAVDETILAEPETWRLRGRVDSAVIARKIPTERHSVCLALPGPMFQFGAIQGVVEASAGYHDVRLEHSGLGWDDFDAIYAKALNMAEAGAITHFAMLHSDVMPGAGWLDILLGEMDDRGADMVSTVLAIKDKRGLTSTGVGDPGNPWGAFRRFTMREVHDLPPTFGIEDTPHPDKYLLHNTGCFVLDLRMPVFSCVDNADELSAHFLFPTRIKRNAKGEWQKDRESEDWFFSRRLAELGARTYATRLVSAQHCGTHPFPNDKPWGTYKAGDEDSAAKWR